jgi:hypothetical protein
MLIWFRTISSLFGESKHVHMVEKQREIKNAFRKFENQIRRGA